MRDCRPDRQRRKEGRVGPRAHAEVASQAGPGERAGDTGKAQSSRSRAPKPRGACSSPHRGRASPLQGSLPQGPASLLMTLAGTAQNKPLPRSSSGLRRTPPGPARQPRGAQATSTAWPTGPRKRDGPSCPPENRAEHKGHLPGLDSHGRSTRPLHPRGRPVLRAPDVPAGSARSQLRPQTERPR